jgi:hypothetical protein
MPVAGLTVAVAASLDRHVTAASEASSGETVAVRAFSAPTATERALGETVTPVTVTLPAPQETKGSTWARARARARVATRAREHIFMVFPTAQKKGGQNKIANPGGDASFLGGGGL